MFPINFNLNDLSFARPAVLWLLLVLPLLALLVWRAERLSRRAVAALVAQRLLPLLSTQVSWGARRFIGGLRIAGLAMVILALAGPRMGYREIERESRGLDIIFLIDTSRSMLARDIQPDRLTRTKLAALDLAEALKGDRLALVAFAGGGFLQVPLTVDFQAMRESIQALDTEIIPTQGTNFSDALKLAMDAFGESDKDNRAIVIFSDGEEWSGEAAGAVRTLSDQGVPVFTVGVGTEAGAEIPVRDRSGRLAYHLDQSGNVVLTKLQETTLKELASQTGGQYFRLDETPRLAEALENGLKRSGDDESGTVTSREPLERYQWPLCAGLVMLALAQLLGDRRSRAAQLATASPTSPGAAAVPAKKRKSSFRNRMLRNVRRSVDPRPQGAAPAWLIALLAGLALAMGFGGPALTLEAKSLGEQALERQKSGDDAKALELYQQQLQKKPDSPLADELSFNAGIAAFRTGKTDEAIRGFSQSLLSEDKSLQELSHYNLGKSFFKKGASSMQTNPQETMKDWERAIEQYENTLKLNPENKQAQANLDFAKQKLEELKQQQPQQDEQQQKQQDQQNQDQNKDDSQKQPGDGQNNPDNKQSDSESQSQNQNQDKPNDQQAQNDQQQKGEGQDGQPQDQDQQAQNDQSKPGEGEKKEDQSGQPGDQQKPDSGQGNMAKDDQEKKPGEQPSVDPSTQEQPKPGEGQQAQDFQRDPNKSGEEQSNGEEGQALAGTPRALTRQEAAALLESLEGDEAKGMILESRSDRGRPPGKDW